MFQPHGVVLDEARAVATDLGLCVEIFPDEEVPGRARLVLDDKCLARQATRDIDKVFQPREVVLDQDMQGNEEPPQAVVIRRAWQVQFPVPALEVSCGP